MAGKGFNKHDISRDACQLTGSLSRKGYDWWWHSFTGYDEETGAPRPFFIEFFLCNPALGSDIPVFGQLPANREAGIRPSYLMVKVGSWGDGAAQLHRFWGCKKISVDWGVPYKIEADDCVLTESFTKGSIKVEGSEDHPEWMCNNGQISWDLKINKVVAFNVGYGAGPFFRRAKLFEMFWHAEGMKSEFTGTVIWNGRRYLVRPEDCYGYADKNWGKNFTSPWVWLSSNNLTSEISGQKLENSVFDIGGGRPKIGPIALKRRLLSAVWYEGIPFEFNFSKFWTFTRTSFSGSETETSIVWHIEQRSTSGKMVVDVTCDKKDMLLVNYESPDGAKRHNRLWNGGNGTGTIIIYDRNGKLVDRIHAENIGCEYGEYDH